MVRGFVLVFSAVFLSFQKLPAAVRLDDDGQDAATNERNGTVKYTLDGLTDAVHALTYHKLRTTEVDEEVARARSLVKSSAKKAAELEAEEAAQKKVEDLASAEGKDHIKAIQAGIDKVGAKANKDVSAATEAEKNATLIATKKERAAQLAWNASRKQEMRAKMLNASKKTSNASVDASSFMIAPAEKGDVVIKVGSTASFHEGEKVLVDNDENIVVALSKQTMKLRDPLAKDYRAMTALREMPVPPSEELKRRALEAEQNQDTGLTAAKATIAAAEAQRTEVRLAEVKEFVNKQAVTQKLEVNESSRVAINAVKTVTDAREKTVRQLQSQVAAAKEKVNASTKLLANATKEQKALTQAINKELTKKRRAAEVVKENATNATALHQKMMEEEAAAKTKRLAREAELRKEREEAAEAASKKLKANLAETEDAKTEAQETVKTDVAAAAKAQRALAVARDALAKLNVKETKERSEEMLQAKAAEMAAKDVAAAAEVEAARKNERARQLEIKQHEWLFTENEAKAAERIAENHVGNMTEVTQEAQKEAQEASKSADEKTADFAKAAAAAKAAEKEAGGKMKELAIKGGHASKEGASV